MLPKSNGHRIQKSVFGGHLCLQERPLCIPDGSILHPKNRMKYEMLAVFWNAARGDPNPNCLIAKFRSNYSCFVQHAINVRPFQYPHDSPRRHIWAAFKCSLVQLPLLPPGQLSREIYSSQQNGSHCTWLPCTGWLECKLQHCTVCCFGGNCTIARGAPAAQFYDCIGCLEAQTAHLEESLHRIWICGQLPQQEGAHIALLLHPALLHPCNKYFWVVEGEMCVCDAE